MIRSISKAWKIILTFFVASENKTMLKKNVFNYFSSKLRGTPTKNVKTLNIFVNSTDGKKKFK